MSMSGSGGGGGDNWRPPSNPISREGSGADEGGEKGPLDPCNISEITRLNSVDRTVLATVRVNDSLSVEFEQGPPSRLVATSGGSTVGSITSGSMIQIIECMTDGAVEYEAIVLEIRGGLCRVQIQPK
jgi:hypothetical protein